MLRLVASNKSSGICRFPSLVVVARVLKEQGWPEHVGSEGARMVDQRDRQGLGMMACSMRSRGPFILEGKLKKPRGVLDLENSQAACRS